MVLKNNYKFCVTSLSREKEFGAVVFKEGASSLTLNKKGVLALNREGWTASVDLGLADISEDSIFGSHVSS